MWIKRKSPKSWKSKLRIIVALYRFVFFEDNFVCFFVCSPLMSLGGISPCASIQTKIRFSLNICYGKFYKGLESKMIHLERNCKVKIKVGHLETRTRPQGPGAQKILPPKRGYWIPPNVHFFGHGSDLENAEWVWRVFSNSLMDHMGTASRTKSGWLTNLLTEWSSLSWEHGSDSQCWLSWNWPW